MIITRYLYKEISLALFATTSILLIIFVTNQFVIELNVAATGQMTMQAVLQEMALQAPIFLGYMLPLGFFLSVLLVLGRLYTEHEMVVIYACGISRAEIVRSILILAFFYSLIAAWLMLWVEPKMQWYRGKIVVEAVTRASFDKILPGRFQPIGKTQNTFYAGAVSSRERELYHVFLAEKLKSAPNQWDVISASTALERNSDIDGQWLIFKNGKRFIGTPGDLDYQIIQFKEYGMRLFNKTPDLNSRVDTLPTSVLIQNRLTNLHMAAELEMRLAMPISLFIFGFLAIPLSHVNPRKGKFARLLPAALIYISYAELLFLGQAWIVKGVISPRWGLWWLHSLIFILGGVLLFLQGRSFSKRRAKKNQPKSVIDV